MDDISNVCCIKYFNEYREEDIDLCICDPPYFRILKSESWDKFTDKSEYLKFTRNWIEAIIPHIRLSGTLVLYGCSVNIDIMCDIHKILCQHGMEFIQEIVIDKGMKSIAGRVSGKLKMLPPVSENIFVYRKDAKPFVKNLLLSKAKESGLSNSQIKNHLGMPKNGGGNWTKWTGDTEFPSLPTKDNWNKLCNLFDIDIPYKNIKETYNAQLGLTNVWNDINFYKPVMLSSRIINLFTDKDDVVAIPFAGSGNDIIACKQLHRHYVATELNKEYYERINKKIEKLFN